MSTTLVQTPFPLLDKFRYDTLVPLGQPKYGFRAKPCLDLITYIVRWRGWSDFRRRGYVHQDPDLWDTRGPRVPSNPTFGLRTIVDETLGLTEETRGVSRAQAQS